MPRHPGGESPEHSCAYSLSWAGWLLGPGPIGALGLGWLARGAKPGPMVPTMPPFFLPGRVIVPDWKKRNKLNRHIMENSRPSMLLDFNVNFVTFLKLH